MRRRENSQRKQLHLGIIPDPLPETWSDVQQQLQEIEEQMQQFGSQPRHHGCKSHLTETSHKVSCKSHAAETSRPHLSRCKSRSSPCCSHLQPQDYHGIQHILGDDSLDSNSGSDGSSKDPSHMNKITFSSGQNNINHNMEGQFKSHAHSRNISPQQMLKQRSDTNNAAEQSRNWNIQERLQLEDINRAKRQAIHNKITELQQIMSQETRDCDIMQELDEWNKKTLKNINSRSADKEETHGHKLLQRHPEVANFTAQMLEISESEAASVASQQAISNAERKEIETLQAEVKKYQQELKDVKEKLSTEKCNFDDRLQSLKTKLERFKELEEESANQKEHFDVETHSLRTKVKKDSEIIYNLEREKEALLAEHLRENKSREERENELKEKVKTLEASEEKYTREKAYLNLEIDSLRQKVKNDTETIYKLEKEKLAMYEQQVRENEKNLAREYELKKKVGYAKDVLIGKGVLNEDQGTVSKWNYVGMYKQLREYEEMLIKLNNLTCLERDELANEVEKYKYQLEKEKSKKQALQTKLERFQNQELSEASGDVTAIDEINKSKKMDKSKSIKIDLKAKIKELTQKLGKESKSEENRAFSDIETKLKFIFDE